MTTAETDLPWVTVADGRDRLERRPPPTMRRALTTFWLASIIALCCIVALSSVISARAAEREALRDARAATSILARSVLEPALENELLDGDPGAIARLDTVVTELVLTENRVRVKLWTADGRIVYSDEPRLIGRQFDLDDDELRVLQGGPAAAHLTDLEGPENTFERSEGELLEVYRHVDLPNGEHLLFETYSKYSQVAERRGEVLREFAPITIGTVLLLQLCQLPLVWTLVRRVRAAHRSSERSLQQAIDASTAERRRIAGDLHDGIVQGLVGASYLISGSVDALERGRRDVGDQLRAAASTVRETIRGLRSMLVEIYPASVAEAGLPAALGDLLAPLSAQGIDPHIATPAAVELPRDVEGLVFRVSQEVLRNVATHSGATTVTLRLDVRADCVELQIADDGIGLNLDRTLHRQDGHVGMQVLRDLAQEAGALLQVRSGPARGTTVRLQVPLSR